MGIITQTWMSGSHTNLNTQLGAHFKNSLSLRHPAAAHARTTVWRNLYSRMGRASKAVVIGGSS